SHASDSCRDCVSLRCCTHFRQWLSVSRRWACAKGLKLQTPRAVMNLRNLIVILPLALPWLGSASTARAAALIVEAGKTHTLQEDVILNGDDVLEVRGTPEMPCVLVGNRHRLRSGDKWTGSLKITHCTIRDLGGLPRRAADDRVQGPGDPAFDLKVAGKGSIVIEH